MRKIKVKLTTGGILCLIDALGALHDKLYKKFSSMSPAEKDWDIIAAKLGSITVLRKKLKEYLP